MACACKAKPRTAVKQVVKKVSPNQSKIIKRSIIRTNRNNFYK